MRKEGGGESGSAAGGEGRGFEVGGKGGWGDREIIVLVNLSLRSIKPEMVGKMLNGENKYKIKTHFVCS